MRVNIHTETLPMFPGAGRHVEHDPRSRDHDVMSRPTPEIKPILWARHSQILDQGQLGSCTGNAMAGWLACEPHCTDDVAGARCDEARALALYSVATQVDPFPGVWPPDDTGSSGNAVAKAARQLGLIRSWSWAFSSTGLLRALQLGPVIVGVPWYENMFNPDAEGTVTATGPIAGGHEFLIRGWDGQFFHADNSWSESWGVAGSFRFNRATWDTLRSNQADVTVPHV